MDDIRAFGQIWEGWEVEKILGEGAYGTVWKAHHQEFGMTYYSAIKHISIPKDKEEYRLLQEEGIVSGEDSAKSFYETMLKNLLEEINLMYSLRGNTRVVSYEDHRIIPKEDGIGYDLFIRMELLQSVTSLIKQRELTSEEVIKLGKDIAEAISLLNRMKIVHRDIKPQNIFINKSGEYKLGDYGTARILEKTATIMSKKGTYSYMAPEIYKKEAATRTVDIYSLGIVMYRLLNGNRQPFLPLSGYVSSADTEEAIMKRVTGTPLPPPAKADPELAKVILKACAYRSEDRYQTGDEMRQALEHLYESPNENSLSGVRIETEVSTRPPTRKRRASGSGEKETELPPEPEKKPSQEPQKTIQAEPPKPERPGRGKLRGRLILFGKAGKDVSDEKTEPVKPVQPVRTSVQTPGKKTKGKGLTEESIQTIPAKPRQTQAAVFRRIGSYVTFGSYPQTRGGTDRTSIEWLVLDYDAAGNRSLLISRYGLDVKPYNEQYTDTTWEKCSLRRWLNNRFFKTAFTVAEQSAILSTVVDNSWRQGYNGYGTNGGNNTEDRLFLLSYTEAWKYFSRDENRKCPATDYAVQRGAYIRDPHTVNGRKAARWWLRSPGDYQDNAAAVHPGGTLCYGIVHARDCVRPAFWINLKSDVL